MNPDKLRQEPIEQICSVDKVHGILRRCEAGKLSVKGTDCCGLKLMPITDEQKSVLKLFDCNYIVNKEFLKSSVSGNGLKKSGKYCE